MKENIVQIENKQGELLHGLLHLKEKKPFILLCHGLGVSKMGELFDTITEQLSFLFSTFRFDFSGYGESGGKMEDFCLSKMQSDLKSVLMYLRQYRQPVSIITHSFGAFAIDSNSLGFKEFNAVEIKNIILIAPDNPDGNYSILSTEKRILSREGGIVNKDGISIYPRTSGEIQSIGPKFWKDLENFDAIKQFSEIANKGISFSVFCAKDDEIVKFDPTVYQPLSSIFKMIDGDHNFTKELDKRRLIEEIFSALD